MIDHGYGTALRAIDGQDLDYMLAWRNDSRIRKWTRQNDELTHAQHMDWFTGLKVNPTIKMYAIGPEQNKLSGVCGLTSIDYVNRRAEFSLYIDPDRHGQGHGPKALKTLLHHAFETLNLNCVWGESFDGNPAQKMFEKIGMTKEGTRRAFYYREGKYVGASLWSMLRSDWDRLVRGGSPLSSKTAPDEVRDECGLTGC